MVFHNVKILLFISFIMVIILCTNVYEVKSDCVADILNVFNNITDTTGESSFEIRRSRGNGPGRIGVLPQFTGETPAVEFLKYIFNKINKRNLFAISLGHHPVHHPFSIFQLISTHSEYQPTSFFGKYMVYLRNQVNKANIPLPIVFPVMIHNYYNSPLYNAFRDSPQFGLFTSISPTMDQIDCRDQLNDAKYGEPYNLVPLLHETSRELIFDLMLFQYDQTDFAEGSCARIYHLLVADYGARYLHIDTFNPVLFCHYRNLIEQHDEYLQREHPHVYAQARAQSEALSIQSAQALANRLQQQQLEQVQLLQAGPD